jgi:hypothetical protein
MVTRLLHVDFDLHADDDLGFKNELIGLMIVNLHELRHALELSLQQMDMSYFRKACHKVSSTMSLLADSEFNEIVEALKKDSGDLNIKRFNAIQAQLVQSLELEKKF